MKTDIDRRLENWSWWCRWGGKGGPPVATHCASIEHRYLPELGEVWGEPETPVTPPDMVDGERVEAAIRTLPMQDRRMFKARYVLFPSLGLDFVARKLRTSAHRLEVDLISAKRRLREALGDE